MNAYDDAPPPRTTMKPVWIVDDDRSIRWVLEKALAREGIAYQSFSSAYEVLQALRRASRRCSSPTSGCPVNRV
jgi:DNA-binding NtrC family response regulator